jgi:hypothetical protein
MKRILRRRPSPATIIALTALLVAVAGVGYAAIPDSSGVIHACYFDRFSRNRPLFRVIDTDRGDRCFSYENELSWNQQGPPGPPGPSTVKPLGDITLSDGESKVLLSQGPLTLTATCRINFVPTGGTSPQDLAEINVSTTQDHAAFGGSFNRDPDLSPSEGSRNTLRSPISPAPVGTPDFNSEHFFAGAPDGTRLSGVLVASVNGLGRTGKCVFGGSLVVG